MLWVVSAPPCCLLLGQVRSTCAQKVRSLTIHDPSIHLTSSTCPYRTSARLVSGQPFLRGGFWRRENIPRGQAQRTLVHGTVLEQLCGTLELGVFEIVNLCSSWPDGYRIVRRVCRCIGRGRKIHSNHMTIPTVRPRRLIIVRWKRKRKRKSRTVYAFPYGGILRYPAKTLSSEANTANLSVTLT